jgi:hypothetical protein
MSNPYINIYKGNPTAAGTDGTAVSTGGTYTEPITIALNASTNETKKVKLAIRCETGYTTVGDTTIADSGDTNDRWKLCLTENGTYTDSITITSAISTTNVVFWAQASSASTESPGTDRTVSLAVTATITAV